MHKKESVPKMHNAPPPPPHPKRKYNREDKILKIRELNVRLEEIEIQRCIINKDQTTLNYLLSRNRQKHKKLCKRVSDTMKFRDQLIKELGDERVSE